MNSGGYDKEEKAARAYDLAALKYWGTSTTTNFPVGFFTMSSSISSNLLFQIPFSLMLYWPCQISNYEKESEEMKHMTRQEYVASLRRYVCVYIIHAPVFFSC